MTLILGYVKEIIQTTGALVTVGIESPPEASMFSFSWTSSLAGAFTSFIIDRKRRMTMEDNLSRNKSEFFKDYFLITIGGFLMALSVNVFLKRYTLAPGGITGFSVIMNKLLGIPIDFVYFGISVPLLILGIKALGKSFGIKTLYVTVVSPLFIRIIPEIKLFDNIILSAILGGLLVGTGIGIALVRNCTTGGTDLAAALLNKLIPKIKIPIFLFMLDGLVVISSGIVSRDFKNAIYSMLSLLVIIKTIDFILKRFSGK